MGEEKCGKFKKQDKIEDIVKYVMDYFEFGITIGAKRKFNKKKEPLVKGRPIHMTLNVLNKILGERGDSVQIEYLGKNYQYFIKSKYEGFGCHKVWLERNVIV